MFQVSDWKKIKAAQIKNGNDALVLLKNMITAGDRKAAMKTFSMNAATLSRYLHGQGRNIDRIDGLLQFFNKRIEERNKRLGDADLDISSGE